MSRALFKLFDKLQVGKLRKAVVRCSANLMNEDLVRILGRNDRSWKLPRYACHERSILLPGLVLPISPYPAHPPYARNPPRASGPSRAVGSSRVDGCSGVVREAK